MSKSTHMSRLIRHLHSVATESCSAIVLSYSEYAILLPALHEFKLNHIDEDATWKLTPEGVAVCDSLYTHLEDHFNELNKPCFK